jgi:predicted ribonuclease YlaK
MGSNSKVILLGDVSQIDTRVLDEFDNGLAHVIAVARGYNKAAHVELQDGSVRSELAAWAAKML